MKVIPVTRREH